MTPVSRNIEDVKKEVFKKIDITALGANKGKKLKHMKHIIQEKYIENFKNTHFGILPFTHAKFKEVCLTYKIPENKLHFNPTSGMISNACMSPHCAYYLQPLSHA